jgi:uncharacterized membrane protein
MATHYPIEHRSEGSVQRNNPGLWPGHEQENIRWKHKSQRKKGEQLARQLGWLSIGLGLVEIAAPQKVTEFLGIGREGRLLLRVCGAREIASGLGLLSQRRTTGWVWSRIAGDMIDVACLSAAFTRPFAKRDRIAAATAMVAGVTAMDWLCLEELNGQSGRAFEGEARPVKKSMAINRPPEDVYRFWRDFQNLSRFMKHILSVQVISDRRSHWVVQGPGRTKVEWDAEITDDQPNEFIAWRTCEPSSVRHSGSVRFMRGPGDRGTILTVKMQYHPPGGVLGVTLATLMGTDPEQQMQEDLRRLRQVMETGEIVQSEGSLFGTGLRQQRPGRPPK